MFAWDSTVKNHEYLSEAHWFLTNLEFQPKMIEKNFLKKFFVKWNEPRGDY